jgi:hypothetical protein
MCACNDLTLAFRPRFEVVEGARLEKYLDPAYQERWYSAACAEFKKNGVGKGPKRYQKKGVKLR